MTAPEGAFEGAKAALLHGGRVLAYLRERPHTLDELVARRLLYPVGVDLPYVECAERRTITQHLAQLQAQGLVQGGADGFYGLA